MVHGWGRGVPLVYEFLTCGLCMGNSRGMGVGGVACSRALELWAPLGMILPCHSSQKTNWRRS